MGSPEGAENDTLASGASAQLATKAFRQILSAAKALAVHHGVARKNGDRYHRNLGHGLAQRYAGNGRTELDYHVMASALRHHYSPAAAQFFTDAMRGTGVAMPFHATDAGEYADPDGAALPMVMIDMFGVAQDRRAIGDMARGRGPFAGPAGVLLNAGMDGLPENDATVGAARDELARSIYAARSAPNRPAA